jgi:hypothetical protein
MPDFDLTQSFGRFGVVRKNPRWSWSGRNADTQTVVLALWGDQFDWKAKPIAYEKPADDPTIKLWSHRHGNRERIENLCWAREHCGGRFRVVMLTAKDKNASPREIADCFPKDGWWMQITYIDEDTGAFRAELVET